jgi:hypothetical protein
MSTTSFTEALPTERATVTDRVPRPTSAIQDIETYRTWVTNHRVSAALLAGLVGVHVATVAGLFMPSIGLPKLDWNTLNGTIITPSASANVQFLSGSLFHYADGILFGVMFAIAVHPLMAWRSTTTGNLLKGFAFGTILATISAVFMSPRVYFPHAHVGFFSHNLGWKVVFAIYLWHWIYGLHLGAIYNVRNTRHDSAAPALAS